MYQGELVFPQRQEITAQEILRRCDSVEDAVIMCLDVAGVNHKGLAFHLGDSPGNLTRKLRRDPHDPRFLSPKDLMDTMALCQNLIPTRYMALKYGHDLHPIKSTLELQLEQERAEKEDLQRKLGYFEELIGKVRL